MATRDTDGFTTSDDTQTFTFDTTQGQTTYTSYTTRGEDTTTQYETTTADDNSTLNETKINVQERNQLKWGAAHFNDLTNRQVIATLALRAGGEKTPPKENSREEIERRNRNDLFRFLRENKIFSVNDVEKLDCKILDQNYSDNPINCLNKDFIEAVSKLTGGLAKSSFNPVRRSQVFVNPEQFEILKRSLTTDQIRDLNTLHINEIADQQAAESLEKSRKALERLALMEKPPEIANQQAKIESKRDDKIEPEKSKNSDRKVESEKPKNSSVHESELKKENVPLDKTTQKVPSPSFSYDDHYFDTKMAAVRIDDSREQQVTINDMETDRKFANLGANAVLSEDEWQTIGNEFNDLMTSRQTHRTLYPNQHLLKEAEEKPSFISAREYAERTREAKG